MKIPRIDWQPERDARLAELWASGMPTKAIGIELGVTKNAVIGRVQRMGPTPRPSPLRQRLRELPPKPVTLITLHNIAPDGCRWPEGHPKETGFHFCGQLQTSGKPYCQAHAKRAYITKNTDKFIPGIGATARNLSFQRQDKNPDSKWG